MDDLNEILRSASEQGYKKISERAKMSPAERERDKEQDIQDRVVNRALEFVNSERFKNRQENYKPENVVQNSEIFSADKKFQPDENDRVVFAYLVYRREEKRFKEGKGKYTGSKHEQYDKENEGFYAEKYLKEVRKITLPEKFDFTSNIKESQDGWWVIEK